jgi:hypothetical protein
VSWCEFLILYNCPQAVVEGTVMGGWNHETPWPPQKQPEPHWFFIATFYSPRMPLNHKVQEMFRAGCVRVYAEFLQGSVPRLHVHLNQRMRRLNLKMGEMVLSRSDTFFGSTEVWTQDLTFTFLATPLSIFCDRFSLDRVSGTICWVQTSRSCLLSS